MAKSDPILAAISAHKKAWQSYCRSSTVADSFPVEVSRGPCVVVGQLIDGHGGGNPVFQYQPEEIDAYFDEWAARAIRGLGPADKSDITKNLLVRIQKQRALAHAAFRQDQQKQQEVQRAHGFDKAAEKLANAGRVLRQAERALFTTHPKTLAGAAALAKHARPFVRDELWSERDILCAFRCIAMAVR